MKTNELRKAIQSILVGLKSDYPIKEVSYRLADEITMFPHIVYDIDTVSIVRDRDDYIVNVDIFDKDNKRVEDIADSVSNMLRYANLPQEYILPTFRLDSRKNVPDDDKSIRHINIRLIASNFER